MAHPGNEDTPALPPHSGRFGGDIAGNFRGDPAVQRQLDRAQLKLRGRALRGFADRIPQSGGSGSSRRNPDDASLSLPDSADGPEKIVARAVRDLVMEGSLPECGLEDDAPVRRRVPPRGLSTCNGSCLVAPR